MIITGLYLIQGKHFFDSIRPAGDKPVAVTHVPAPSCPNKMQAPVYVSGRGCGLDSGLWLSPVAGACEDDNEHSGSVKGGQFVDHLSYC
jgi:hypothetical protein